MKNWHLFLLTALAAVGAKVIKPVLKKAGISA